ncbi:MAG: hypothetical protein ACRDHH_02975 [Actinomycetota bacterium]
MMLGWLRRRQPRNPVLAVLFWMVATLVALAVLFVLFYWLDNYLPGQGMF